MNLVRHDIRFSTVTTSQVILIVLNHRPRGPTGTSFCQMMTSLGWRAAPMSWMTTSLGWRAAPMSWMTTSLGWRAAPMSWMTTSLGWRAAPMSWMRMRMRMRMRMGGMRVMRVGRQGRSLPWRLRTTPALGLLPGRSVTGQPWRSRFAYVLNLLFR
jgi:hypothetical protein